ncbi:MAG: endolytic transglycosylase MltG, partial [candidate division Zixibacteria bacterium]|nr:endolytic transglycosylase MltG [candidate division Zixibacteria bacterium]
MFKKGILIFVLIIVIVFTYLYNSYTAVYDIGEMKISILIKQGDSFSKVANQIIDKKLLDSKLLLKLMARFNGIDKKLTPGKYEFTGEYSCATIFNKLEKADFVRIKLTIPEGLTLWKMASLLSNRFGFDSTEI